MWITRFLKDYFLTKFKSQHSFKSYNLVKVSQYIFNQYVMGIMLYFHGCKVSYLLNINQIAIDKYVFL
jgi:hypothetical protein